MSLSGVASLGILLVFNVPTRLPTKSLDAKGNKKPAYSLGNRGLIVQTWTTLNMFLAEGVRFELTKAITPRQFSRLVHSTALPTFQALYYSWAWSCGQVLERLLL